MNDYLNNWYENLVTQTSIPVKSANEGWGECDIHTGGLLIYARVRIRISPSEDLHVNDHLDRQYSALLNSNNWFDYIIYGVLDVMLVDKGGPHKKFSLDILEVLADEIRSKPIAFRLAARDATMKILHDSET